jgi:hypothetical protein
MLNNIAELNTRVSYTFDKKVYPYCFSKKQRRERNTAMEENPRRMSGEGEGKEKHL